MQRVSLFSKAACVLAVTASQVWAQENVAQFSAKDAQGTTPLLVRSTTDIAVLEPVLTAFVARNPGLSVTYEQWGSNALYDASLAACADHDATADAVFSSAIQQMIDLVNRACARPYRSALTTNLPASRRWRDELWGITKEPAVIIYNTDLVPIEDAPETRFALLDLMRRPESIYDGKIATYDIEGSGLGYLFAFMDSLEATTFGALLEGFARTHAVATCCSSEIIAGVSRGDYLIAYNVLGSYVDRTTSDNIGIIQPLDYTLFLSRAYMIPKTATHPEAAALLLDFMLSPEGVSLLRDQNLFYSEDTAGLPLQQSAERTIAIEPTLLVAGDRQKRDQFVNRWRSAFARQDSQR